MNMTNKNHIDLQIRRISATNLPKRFYLQDLCNPSRTEAFAVLRLRHCGVVPSHPILCKDIIPFSIFYNVAFRQRFTASVTHMISAVSLSYTCLTCPCIILFDLAFRIWSKLKISYSNFFQLTTCPNLILPDINLFHLMLPVAFVVGWRLDNPHPFPQDPPIPWGGGGLMGFDDDHGRGAGGGTRNLEHICLRIICAVHSWCA